jgi:type IV pilus assembly protein PilA
MLERIWKARRDERGFTLIELIMVLVILGILLALALPAYLGTRKKAYIAEADQNLQEMRTQLWLYYVEKGSFSTAGLTLPTSPNWVYSASCTTNSCTLRASAAGASNLASNPLDGTEFVQVVLNNDGSASTSSGGF